MRLLQIDENNDFQCLADKPELMAQLISLTRALYQKVGYIPPWICYFAYDRKQCTGTCGFKYPPRENKVEIAYFTFPGFEGKGYASEMVKELIQLANSSDANITITARTLCEKNASTRILEKSGFQLIGEVNDEEDGIVWEWIF
ncbi:MAG: GNAT family N-acetyltransferase [Candidatus Omnitrophica bacterium]|nr:GNAT family N-acetyltransferase [Candidatus Omnitrophota bacterium]